MIKAIFLMLCLLAVAEVAFSQDKKCSGQPKLEENCAKKNCIPPVKETSIAWGDVTPKSFFVKWKPSPGARCYYVELLRGYTVKVIKTISCFKGTVYEFKDLRPSRIYGVKVSAVTDNCVRGKPGVPARTRTLWAPTVKPTTKAFVTPTPEPGACGKRFFTCHSDKTECVRNKKWCDRVWDCTDGSDERGCPGSCEEIDIEFPNGNYTCTRFSSPGSVCLFDCQGVHVRDGPRYTYCSTLSKKWTNAIPTCRLPPTTKLVALKEQATGDTITLQWEPIEEAVRYNIVVIEVTDPNQSEPGIMRTLTVEEDDCEEDDCEVLVENLIPETEFKVTLVGVDENDVEGKPSLPLHVTTASKSESEFPEVPDEPEEAEEEEDE